MIKLLVLQDVLLKTFDRDEFEELLTQMPVIIEHQVLYDLFDSSLHRVFADELLHVQVLQGADV